MTPRLALPVLLALVACDEQPPLIEDPDIPGSVLRGDVVVEGADETAPTVLLMSTEEDPMPPLGTGFPITFAAVGASTFGPPGDSLKGAPYAFTDVAPGGYYLNAIMDVDRNFHPEVLALSSASCGDHVGWHTYTTGGDPAPVQVGEDEVVDGVMVGPLVKLDEPRPTAAIDGTNVLTLNGDVRIDAVAVDATFGDGMDLVIPGPWDGGDDTCAASYVFERRDRDGDGSVDANPLFPLLEDRVPQTIFLWLGVPVDDDNDGSIDRFDDSAEAGNTVAAIGDPAPIGGALPGPGEPLRTNSLDVRFTGLGQRILPSGESELLGFDDMPKGAWQLVLVGGSGMLWFLPNELGPREARALPGAGLVEGGLASQDAYFVIE